MNSGDLYTLLESPFFEWELSHLGEIRELDEMKFKLVSRKSTRDWYVKVLEANLDFYREELAILDRKANRYEVPRSWR